MTLRVIPTGVHGMLDYLASGINLTFPGLLGLHDAPWAATVPRIDGLAGLVYSLFTDYELGAFKVLPVPAHLAFDAAKGLFMAFSPWLFGFAKNGARYWLPHALMGTAAWWPRWRPGRDADGYELLAYRGLGASLRGSRGAAAAGK